MKTSLTQTAGLSVECLLSTKPRPKFSSLAKLSAFAKFASILALVAVVLCVAFSSAAVHAAIDVYEFESEQQEAQYRHLIDEFRCPKCQNQNLAGSDSQIAQDLKRKTYEMVLAGQTDAQIRDYMYDRYGAFISYKPPIRPSTWILWFFPPLILVMLIGWWLWRNAHLNKVGQAVAVDDDSVTGNPSVINSAPSELSEQEAAALNDLLQSHQSDAPNSYGVDNGVNDSGHAKTKHTETNNTETQRKSK